MPVRNNAGPDPVVAALTLEEKASLTSGAGFWETTAAPGVPSIMLTDGPHGVRRQATTGDHLGLNESVPATCFPPAVTLGSTWDAALLERAGAGVIVQPEDYTVETIQTAVRKVIGDPSFRAAAERIRDEIAAMPDADSVCAALDL